MLNFCNYLQAKHEEVNTDYSNLQQQYVRLSEDHQKIVNGQKEDFERLKDTKDKESRSLQGKFLLVNPLFFPFLIAECLLIDFTDIYISYRQC